jgi:peptidoglycan/LPS O-acetylase OafA/YrhL
MTAGVAASRAGTSLPTLTSLRFAAAALVALYHAGLYADPFSPADPPGPFHFGYVGVTFFFVLSGFVLTWTWRREDRARSFYLRRFARIWPVHLLTALVAIVIAIELGPPIPNPPVVIPLNLTLAQSWCVFNNSHNVDYSYVYSLNFPSWSLSDEAFFYAMFPLVIGLVAMRRRSPTVLVLGAWASLLAVGVFVFTRHQNLAQSLSFLPLYRIGEFLVGIGLALMVRRGVRLRISVWLGVLIAVGSYCLLWPAEIVVPGFNDYDYLAGLLVIPGFSLAIMAAASRDADGGRGVLQRRFAVKLGQWSFALYMVHDLLLRIADPHLPQMDHFPLRVLLTSAVVILAIVVAAAVYEWYERPIERRIRAWANQGESLIAQPSMPPGVSST